MAFRGNYEHTLDAKNRLTIPSKLRDQLGVEVVIGQSLENCAAIWTPDGFDAYTAAFLQGLHPLSDEARDLTAYFSGNSFDSELDKAGRAMIPGNLLRDAAIERDVVVVGAHDHLQLWSPANWAARSAGVAANLKSTVAKIVSAG
ncbi:MAG: division/cell wall cluster transcriptional repressor MraZ [Solirubrobacterales bacterium]